MRAQLISIGDEILIGNTVDTNSNYIAGKLTRLGVLIERIIAIHDDTATIVRELKESTAKYDVVVTTGGLGPTWDDGTVTALAKHLEVDLKLNQAAFEMVKGTYRRLQREKKIDSAEITPERKKMAVLPDYEGLTLIPNPVGVAPGLHVVTVSCNLFVLPGVPKEMKAMVPYIEQFIAVKSGIYYHEKRINAPISAESSLAPFLHSVREKYPGCYVKSTPSAHSRSAIPVIFSAADEDKYRATKLVNDAAAYLVEIIRDRKGDDLLQLDGTERKG